MIRLNRTVRRQTAEIEPRSRRPLVIELIEGGRLVRIREKGRKTGYTVTYQQIFVLGARNRAVELKLAKQQRREERRKQRNGRS